MLEHCGTENRCNPPMPGLDGVRVEECCRGVGLDLVPRSPSGRPRRSRWLAAARVPQLIRMPSTPILGQPNVVSCETVGKTGNRAVGEQPEKIASSLIRHQPVGRCPAARPGGAPGTCRASRL